MKKEFDDFIIEYTEDDLTYIDDLIQQFLPAKKRIMEFFNLDVLDKKVHIQIWNDMGKYEKYIKNEMKRIFDVTITINDWEVGRAITTREESQIHLLSYKERLKRKGHSEDSLDSVIKVSIHEFVHTCHAQYKQYHTTLTWLNEALATVLSGQYSNQELVLDCTLEEFLQGKINYVKYYTLGKYIFENRGNDYILQLEKNNELLKEKTPILFEEAKKWVSKQQYENIQTPEELSKWMTSLEYKWLDQNGNFHDKPSPDMYENYSLMSPMEVIENKCGICVDQVELERDWFEKHNINHEVLNIQIFRENTSPGHVFLIYNADNKWYWFENAWGEFAGIHNHLTRNDAIEDIKSKFIIQNQIEEYELSQLKIEEHIKHPFHSSYEDMDQYDTAKIKQC